MPNTTHTIAVTGVTGNLGALAVEKLLARGQPASQIVGLARTPSKAAALQAKGVTIRTFDFEQPATTLASALAGVDFLLLVSSSEVGKRAAQHQHVIDAAKSAGVKLIAYTSLLHTDTSALTVLPAEHNATEAALKASGVPHVLLRNGWYNENYESSIGGAVAQGKLMGASAEGKIASASRADYADAAAAVLLADDAVAQHAGKTYELAGDEAYTLAELAGEVQKQSGKTVEYVPLDRDAYKAALESIGLPEPIAEMLADSDNGAAQGGLFDNSKTLSALTGKPTTPIAETVAATLKQ
ncbi:uncharacterized protein MONBRDRAFT_36236 [Monosiga brevicollis MX1]|uniref:NmrA-like domain-containing protein n=1 Tax=Monosiga brevicollis TaxID=81824 RepID=A9UTY0_MONBE|nr:uncharacterized protein MONBRDRAFT_36236 [Monosiga brevicollis MX1]EDQ91572.1 predicted protein [Monosiga brevicollis MX1]|eukprot:XP_001743994.1 hypothetical protein [Monosiga brevicollis MX1]